MNPSDPSNPPQTQPLPTAAPPAISLGRGQLANFCAGGVAVCFFLPWVSVLFVRPSGFDFQKESAAGKALWLMPVLAAVTVITGLTGKSQKIVGLLAGLAPFAILAYGFSQEGKGLINALAPGAWLALGLGAALIASVRR